MRRALDDAVGVMLFAIGNRVRFSDLGRSRSSPKLSDVQGKVVGHSFSGMAVKVLWDGRRSPHTYHHTYLERVADSEPRQSAIRASLSPTARVAI